MKAGLFLMVLGVAMLVVFYIKIAPQEFSQVLIWGGIISFLAGILAMVIGQFAGKRTT